MFALLAVITLLDFITFLIDLSGKNDYIIGSYYMIWKLLHHWVLQMANNVYLD